MTWNTRHLKSLLALALLFTLLNSFKPLCIDDTLYYYNARQMASHPFEPYGHQLFWNDLPSPAIEVLAPPLFSYYWSIAINLFGERPLLWKLWLLPLSLLLVFALAALFRRFAEGHELSLTCLTIISPVFLPSFNLMLEVPVAALGLTALALFLRAHDCHSYGWAALAGLVAGLAMQTKYTAFVMPGLMLLYAILFGRVRLGLLAALVAAAVFWSFEGFIALRAGHSHLLYQSQVYGSVNLLRKYLYLSWPLLTLMGGVAPALALLGLVTLGARRRVIIAAGACVALGYVLIGVLPASLNTLSRDAVTGEEKLTLAHLIFSIYGVAVYGILAVVVRRLLELKKESWANVLAHWREHRVELFLTLWLLIEIAAYFALSPIPAVRRMTLLLVVSTLLIGRLASRACAGPERKALMRGVLMGGMLLGLLFYGVDLHDAFVEKLAVDNAAMRLDEFNSHATRWYVGRWGFQFYAERAGMKPVLPEASQLQTGDWLIVSDGPYWTKPLAAHLSKYKLETVAHLSIEDSLRLATMIGYYNSGIPIHHQEGPHRNVYIYRVAGELQD
jgi:4-amino-4-deoxy-L-arabinose transferase-like glycosyltransferase